MSFRRVEPAVQKHVFIKTLLKISDIIPIFLAKTLTSQSI